MLWLGSCQVDTYINGVLIRPGRLSNILMRPHLQILDMSISLVPIYILSSILL
jgi:hypothetical protein